MDSGLVACVVTIAVLFSSWACVVTIAASFDGASDSDDGGEFDDSDDFDDARN